MAPSTDRAETKAVRPAERAAVTFAGLKEEFGPEEGEAKYFAIARLEGEIERPTGEKVTGRYFFDPIAEGPLYRPDLVIASLPPEVRKRVADIITTRQVKE